MSVSTPPAGLSESLSGRANARDLRARRFRPSAAPGPDRESRRGRRPSRQALVARPIGFSPVAACGSWRVVLFAGLAIGSWCATMPANVRARKKRFREPGQRHCSPGTTSTGACCPGARSGAERADPYRVWLTEIMLQQTTVPAVAAYYRKFLARWPNVKALAAAKQDDVLAAWAGLGYYARARNLHARRERSWRTNMGGKFPRTAEELARAAGRRALTRRARLPRSPLTSAGGDGRQCRAGDRAALCRRDAAAQGAKPKLARARQALVPERAGDFAQALMDLGAAICTPKRPACANCPWADDCVARKRGIAGTTAGQGAEAGAAAEARRGVCRARCKRRGAAGQAAGQRLAGRHAGAAAGSVDGEISVTRRRRCRRRRSARTGRSAPGIVRHGFTHFELEIEVYVARWLAKRCRKQRARLDRRQRKAAQTSRCPP